MLLLTLAAPPMTDAARMEQLARLELLQLLSAAQPEPLSAGAAVPQRLPIISLHMAADCQLLDMCEQVLEQSPADIGLKDDRGFVPFYLAGMKGQVELLATLHEAALRHFGPSKRISVSVAPALNAIGFNAL